MVHHQGSIAGHTQRQGPQGPILQTLSFSAEEWIQLEKTSRLNWKEGLTRFFKEGQPLGFHKITKGPNKGQDSNRPITRNSLYGVNKGNGTSCQHRLFSN